MKSTLTIVGNIVPKYLRINANRYKLNESIVMECVSNWHWKYTKISWMLIHTLHLVTCLIKVSWILNI